MHKILDNIFFCFWENRKEKERRRRKKPHVNKWTQSFHTFHLDTNVPIRIITHMYVFCFDVAWLHIVLACFLQEKPVRPPCGITMPGCISMTTQQRESPPSLSRTSCTPCSLAPASLSCSETRWKGESDLSFAALSLKLHAYTAANTVAMCLSHHI